MKAPPFKQIFPVIDPNYSRIALFGLDEYGRVWWMNGIGVGFQWVLVDDNIAEPAIYDGYIPVDR